MFRSPVLRADHTEFRTCDSDATRRSGCNTKFYSERRRIRCSETVRPSDRAPAHTCARPTADANDGNSTRAEARAQGLTVFKAWTWPSSPAWERIPLPAPAGFCSAAGTFISTMMAAKRHCSCTSSNPKSKRMRSGRVSIYPVMRSTPLGWKAAGRISLGSKKITGEKSRLRSAQRAEDLAQARVRVHRLKLRRAEVAQHRIVAGLVGLAEGDQRCADEHVELVGIGHRRCRRADQGRLLRRRASLLLGLRRAGRHKRGKHQGERRGECAGRFGIQRAGFNHDRL